MRFFCAFLVCALAVSAQPQRASTHRTSTNLKKAPVSRPKAAAEQAWPIATLKVEGNKRIPSQRILEVAKLVIGQTAGKAEFDAAQTRLLESGMFETVGYRFDPVPGQKGYAASLQVTEIEQLFPFRFEALDINPQEFRDFLRTREPLIADRLPGTRAMLDRLARHAAEFTRQKGSEQRVIAKLSADKPGSLIVVLQPDSLPSVAEVHFQGSRLIPAATLQQAIAGTAVGSVFTETRFRQILDATIRPLFEAKGHLRVAFPRIETTPAQDVKGLVISVQVQDGPEYKLRKVTVEGTSTMDASLLKEGNFHLDDTVNYNVVNSGVEAISQAMRRNGYIEVKTTADRSINEAGKTVDVAVHVKPGPQFKMGQLTIDGLDIQTEPHIRKLWALKPGQPFNAEYPEYFLARLNSDQLFDNLGKTNSVVTPNKDSQIVDVALKIKGDGKPKPRIGPLSPKEERQQRPEGPLGPPF